MAISRSNDQPVIWKMVFAVQISISSKGETWRVEEGGHFRDQLLGARLGGLLIFWVRGEGFFNRVIFRSFYWRSLYLFLRLLLGNLILLFIHLFMKSWPHLYSSTLLLRHFRLISNRFFHILVCILVFLWICIFKQRRIEIFVLFWRWGYLLFFLNLTLWGSCWYGHLSWGLFLFRRRLLRNWLGQFGWRCLYAQSNANLLPWALSHLNSLLLHLQELLCLVDCLSIFDLLFQLISNLCWRVLSLFELLNLVNQTLESVNLFPRDRPPLWLPQILLKRIKTGFLHFND